MVRFNDIESSHKIPIGAVFVLFICKKLAGSVREISRSHQCFSVQPSGREGIERVHRIGCLIDSEILLIQP